jgi:hypothetical protein
MKLLRMNSSAIKVVARFRPPNALELSQGGETVVSFQSDDTLSLDMKSVPLHLNDGVGTDSVCRAVIQADIHLLLIDVLISIQSNRISLSTASNRRLMMSWPDTMGRSLHMVRLAVERLLL